MSTGLGLNQILARINPIYHNDFQRHVQPRLQREESCVWAGNYSPVESFPTFDRDNRDYASVGYLLLTSYRLIQVCYCLRYGRGCSEIALNVDKYKGLFIERAAFPLSSAIACKESGPTVSDILLRNIVTTRPDEADGVDSLNQPITYHTLYFIVQQPEQTCCWLFFSMTDRDEFYNNLHRAMSSTSPPAQQSLLDELQKLHALYKSGALTDAEFQNAKRKLGI